MSKLSTDIRRPLLESIELYFRSHLKKDEAERAIFALNAAVRGWEELAPDTPASPQQRMTAREFRDAQCFQENQWDDERAEAFAARDRRELEESNEAVTALVERYLKRIFHSEVNLKMCEARAETAEFRLRELEEQVAQFEKDVEGETFQVEQFPMPTLADALCNACQLLDSVKSDWQKDGCWSAWDQNVRDALSRELKKCTGKGSGEHEHNNDVQS